MANDTTLDYFLKSGNVEGESEVQGFQNQIRVISWSWVGAAASSIEQSGGSSSGKPALADLAVSLVVDKGTFMLLKGFVTGFHANQAVMTGIKTTGDNALKPYLKITLTQAYISGMSISASSGSGMNVDVTVSYDTITFEYSVQGSSGALVSTGPVSYSRVKQIAS